MDKNSSNELIEKEYFSNLGISCESDISEFKANKTDYIKIDPSVVGRIDSVMQIMPNILLGASYGTDTYRVIYDKGLGVLQKAANNPGMYRGNIVAPGTNNSIKGSVLLQELSMGPQIVSGVFSVMSMVTGQYYMSQINSKLDNIEKSIEEVQKFLEDDKRSVMESEEEFLRNTQANYQSIIDNDDMRNATLCNIQKIKMDSLANINFYKKQIGDLKRINTKKDKSEDVFNNIQKINYLISEYWFSLYLYCFASCLEPVIGRHYDENYIEYIKADMRQKCEQYKSDFQIWKKKLEEYIKTAKAFDENKIIKGIKIVGESNIHLGNVYWFMAQRVAGVAADVANSVDKKKKKEKQDKAFDDLKKMNPCSDIKAIESKQEDLLLFNLLNNGRLEIIKDKEDMYIKIQSEDKDED